jgi:cytochrome c556
MSNTKIRIFLAVVCLAGSSLAVADTPQHERHELMEGVGKAAKVIGAMFRGEAEYDAAAVQESLATFADAAGKFGELFPEGSETGEGTEAAPAIWEDRDGFNAALQEWADATAAAIAAAPATLEEARPTVGPVFQTCKGCHDDYRIEDE